MSAKDVKAGPGVKVSKPGVESFSRPSNRPTSPRRENTPADVVRLVKRETR